MISVIAEEMAKVLGVAFLHIAAENVVTNRKAFKSALSHMALYRSRRLRVSMSQILSIKTADDRYVLIQSAKRPQATAIGGVVRYFSCEISRLEGRIGFEPELTEGRERYDLRGYLKGKNFVRFLRWYASGAGREKSSLAREIEEEFNEIGISSITPLVRRPEFVVDRVVHEGPNELEDEGYWQYRYFEVLSLREESDVSRQLADFIRDQAGKNPKLFVVSTAEIKKGRTKDGNNLIGDSSGYLFSDSAHGVKPPPLI